MARRRKVRFSGRFYLTMLVLLGIVVALVLIIPSGGAVRSETPLWRQS